MRLLLAYTLVMAVTAATAAEPIRVHPKNPRIFLFRGKPTVLVTSGEHYGAVLNLDFDQVRYLDTLKKHGFNLTRTFAGTYAEEWGEPWNTLNPPKGRFLTPWARSETPGYADGGNKFDLNRFDPAYFTRLKSFLREAGRRGVVVELVLFCTTYSDGQWNLSPMNARNNVNGIGTVERTKVWTDPPLIEVHEKLVRKVTTELKGIDNFYLELVNEPYFGDAPVLGHPWNDRMVKAIREVDPKRMIALNVANGNQKVEKVPDGIAVLNYHYASPPTAIEQNWGLRVPIGFDESGFRGSGPDPYRREAWEFMLSGGAVYSGLDWTYTVASPTGEDRSADPKLGLTDPSFKGQLSVLKRFLDRFPILEAQPLRIEGASCLAIPGKVYGIYTATRGKDLTFDLPKGRYRLTWTNPLDGRTTKPEPINHPGGPVKLTADHPEAVARLDRERGG